MKRLLVVVDMQVDFVNGTLGFDGAEKIIPGIVKKIGEYKANGDTVVYTLDTHTEDYLNTQEGRILPVEHCIKGTEGHKLVPELRSILENERAFDKPVFGSMELGRYIEENNSDLEVIEVCGLVSNICVISNAVIARAAAPEAEIVIDTSLTASFDPKLNSETFDILKGLQATVA